MTQNSRVLRLPGAPFVPLRLEFLVISKSNYCAAKLLALFEHWTNCKAESVEVATGQFAQDDDLWLEGNRLDHIQKRLLDEYSLKTISSAIQHLEGLGFILSRSGKGTDRTKAYRLEVRELNVAIANISQESLAQYVDAKRAETIVVKQSVKMQNAIGKNAECNRQNYRMQSAKSQIDLYTTIDNSSIDHSLDERAREIILSRGQDNAHEQLAALEQNYESVPQQIFPRRPVVVANPPKFCGPWGVGRTEELSKFESWLNKKAIAANKPEPRGWVFRVVQSIADGGPLGMWEDFKQAESLGQLEAEQQGPSIREAIAKELNCSDPLSGYGGSDFRSLFNNLGYSFESRVSAFKRKYANFRNLDEFIELAIYNGVLQPPTSDWCPTHPRSELEALVA